MKSICPARSEATLENLDFVFSPEENCAGGCVLPDHSLPSSIPFNVSLKFLRKNDLKAKSSSFHFENEMHQHNDTTVAPPAGASHCLSARESYLLFVNQ